MKVFTMICLLLFYSHAIMAQTKLEHYIEIGLKNNELLQQQRIQLEQATYALKEAKSLFYPSVSLNSTYFIARGGRTINFPIGDILNPVYNSLNQLTNSNAFQPLQNESILLNPDNFLDANIRTLFPIINAELIYNKRIKSKMVDLQQIEIDIYKRELVKDIKVAYFNYLQANEAIKIVENALALTRESHRINTSLFNNDRVNRTALSRSDNEVIKVTAQLESALKTKLNAQYYFNFILNKPLDADIEVEKIEEIPIDLSSNSINNREELQKLKEVTEVNNTNIDLANAFQLPKLNAFIDVGAQAFDFEFDRKSRYYFGGLSLQWDIFSGYQNKWKVKQARLDNELVSSQISNVEQQLALQLKIAENSLITKITDYQAAQSQVSSSQHYYNDVLRLYKEGQVLYIELLDAQNQLISTQLQASILRFDTWIAQVELERASASFNLK